MVGCLVNANKVVKFDGLLVVNTLLDVGKTVLGIRWLNYQFASIGGTFRTHSWVIVSLVEIHSMLSHLQMEYLQKPTQQIFNSTLYIYAPIIVDWQAGGSCCAARPRLFTAILRPMAPAAATHAAQADILWGIQRISVLPYPTTRLLILTSRSPAYTRSVTVCYPPSLSGGCIPLKPTPA